MELSWNQFESLNHKRQVEVAWAEAQRTVHPVKVRQLFRQAIHEVKMEQHAKGVEHRKKYGIGKVLTPDQIARRERKADLKQQWANLR